MSEAIGGYKAGLFAASIFNKMRASKIGSFRRNRTSRNSDLGREVPVANEGGPLRVLAILEAESISGTAKAVLEMAYEAQADSSRDFKIEIIIALFARTAKARDNSLTRALQTAGIPFHFIDEKRLFDFSVLRQIRDLTIRTRAHVIWTNSVKSHFLVRLSQAAKLAKWVAFHHGYTSTDRKMRLYNQFDWISLRRSDRAIAVCLPFVDELESRGVRKSRIRVQHMPIRPFQPCENEAARVRAELGLDVQSKIILSVGRLSYEKGHANLLDAFSLLLDETGDPDLKLVIVGDGTERAALERRAARTQAKDRIIFTGHRDDVASFYGLADVFALPSYGEGTPNVLLESMAAGVPIVATAVGGVPELVENERSALLVPPGDPSALAYAINRLLESPALVAGLAKAAEEVVKAHSPRRYFESMRSIFVEVADTHTNSTPMVTTFIPSKQHAQDGRGVSRPAERASEFLSSLAARSRALCASSRPAPDARQFFKRAIQSGFMLLTLPLALLCGFGRSSVLFTFFAQTLAICPGVLGSFLRAAFYKWTLQDCSIDVVIGSGSYFSRTRATVCPNVSIGSFCVIGSVQIGARSQISSHVDIPGKTHHLRDAAGRLSNAIEPKGAPLTIGEDCWIGASAVVMANVGAQSTIGAGSVVVKDIPSGVVAVGSPAKPIKSSLEQTPVAFSLEGMELV